MVFIIVLTILLLDQVSKIVITRNLLYGESIPIIKGIFHFTLIHNRGAAFGILRNQIPLLTVTSAVAVILIYFSLRRKKQGKIYNISLTLILAGALGNLIDRLFFGYVIDFLDFRIWPVFNIADSCITIGAILLAWNIFNSRGRKVTRTQGHL